MHANYACSCRVLVSFRKIFEMCVHLVGDPGVNPLMNFHIEMIIAHVGNFSKFLNQIRPCWLLTIISVFPSWFWSVKTDLNSMSTSLTLTIYILMIIRIYSPYIYQYFRPPEASKKQGANRGRKSGRKLPQSPRCNQKNKGQRKSLVKCIESTIIS